jgi:hypothetical protein
MILLMNAGAIVLLLFVAVAFLCIGLAKFIFKQR